MGDVIRFLVHANLPFNVVDGWYFKDWVHSVRPTYDPPSRYVIRNRIFDGESSRVDILELDRLINKTKITLLFDGWEDNLKRSLYGLVAAIVGEFPSIISLDDVSGERGTASNHLETIVSALEGMSLGEKKLDVKNIIALTTDNPTVMQALRRMFQEAHPWVLVCDRGFMVRDEMIITVTITYYRSSHAFSMD